MRDKVTNRRSDAGFTLIEVMVACGLLLVLVTASLVVLGWTQRSTRDNSYRTTAMNLAARELAITADTFNSMIRGPKQVEINEVVNPDQLAGQTAGNPLVVDNVPYTVSRTAQWASVGSTAASTCDEGTTSELAYLRVHVEVTWPGGTDRPVTMNTVLTPVKGTYSKTEGHIGLKVIDRDGLPRSGQPVTISGPSGTKTASTADDGCVLFAFLDPGSYTVTLNTAGYVDIAGTQNSVRTVTVTAGQLWRGSVGYDKSAAVTVTFATAAGYALPATNALPIMLASSAGTLERTGSGNARSVSGLWPYASGYQAWAGHCLDNDPANLGEDRGAVVDSDPGSVTTTTVNLAPLTVTRGGGTDAVTAVSKPSINNSQSPCTNMTVQLGTTTSGKLKTSLPYGRWTITANGKSADVTLTQAGGAKVVAL